MRRWLCLLALAGLARAAETYVVAVGIDKYDRDYAVSTLSYAVADVKAVAQAFRDTGVPERNVKLLSSDQTDPLARPTAANVLDALARAARRCERGDLLVFMFSGHGLQAGDVSYLLTCEADPDRLDRTALRVAEVREALEQARDAQLVLLLDACRNEPRAAKGGGDAALDERFAKGMTVWPKSAPVVLLACDVGQRAWEDPDAGHGAFTTCLLRGLTKDAREADGSVKLGRLAEYVTQAVPDWAKRRGRQQTPRLERPPGLDFVLVRAPAVEVLATSGRVQVTTHPAGAKVFVDGQDSGQVSDCLLVLEVGLAREKEFELGFQLEGYETALRKVKVTRGTTVALSVTLAGGQAMPVEPRHAPR